MSNSSTNSDDPESLFAEFLTRLEDGKAADFDELVRMHPAAAVVLRRMYDDWREVGSVVRGAAPGGIFDSTSLPATGSVEAPQTAMSSRELLELFRVEGGRYRFRSVLGRGGMGVVLNVWDRELHRSLAMKVVLARPESRSGHKGGELPARLLARFLDEAQITAQLDHPGIVPVHECGSDSTQMPYFTMKLVKGESFQKIIRHVHQGRDGWRMVRALGVLVKACEALAYAHSRGVVHRDIKPANLMVGRFGEAYLMDWGCARLLHRPGPSVAAARGARVRAPRTFRKSLRNEHPDSPLFSRDGDIIGTPAYMSPEQARGDLEEVGARSDIYSLGALLYHLLADRPPFGAAEENPQEVLRQVTDGAPTPLAKLAPDAPAELVAIAEKAMAREPQARYAGAQELAEDLRAFLEERVVSAFESGTWAETRKWVLRNRALAAAIMTVLAVSLAGTAVFAVQAREARRMALAAIAASERQDALARQAEEQRDRATFQSYAANISAAYNAYRITDATAMRSRLEACPDHLRNWEWDFLAAQTDGSIATLGGDRDPFGDTFRTHWDGLTAGRWDAARSTLEDYSSQLGNPQYVLAASRIHEGVRFVSEAVVGNNICAQVTDCLPQGPVVVASIPIGPRGEWSDTPAFSASFSASGNLLAIIPHIMGAESSLWDCTRWSKLRDLPRNSYAGDISPNDDHLIISRGYDDPVVIGKTTDISSIPVVGLQEPTHRCFFSPTGDRIVAISRDAVRVWDLGGRAPIATFIGHEGTVYDACFSPDGSLVATASEDGSARIWDVSTQREMILMRDHGDAVLHVAFSPDGNYLATGSRDTTCRLWRVPSGSIAAVLFGHDSMITALAFSPDGAFLATRSANETKVWSSASWERTNSPVDTRAICLVDYGGYPMDDLAATLRILGRVCFSPDSSMVVAGDALIDVATRQLIDSLRGNAVRPIASLLSKPPCGLIRGVSQDGLRFVVESSGIDDSRLLRIWSPLEKFNPGVQLLNRSSIVHASLDMSGRISTLEDNGRVAVSELAADRKLLAFYNSNAHATYLSPSGSRLLVVQEESPYILDCTSEASALLLEVTGRVSGETPDWTLLPTNVWGWSTGGSHILGLIDRDTMAVWESLTGQQVCVLRGHSARITHAAWSPDDSRIVSVACDGAVKFWDTTSGVELLSFQESSASEWTDVKFSPDGSKVAAWCTDQGCNIWDATPTAKQVDAAGKMFRAIETAKLVIKGQLQSIRRPDVPSNEVVGPLDVRAYGAALCDEVLDAVVRYNTSIEILLRSDCTAEDANALIVGIEEQLQLLPCEPDIVADYALALYRAGRYGDVRKVADHCEEVSDSAMAITAMAYSRSGLCEEATTMLEEARRHRTWRNVIFDEAVGVVAACHGDR